ncbi:MAG TPA: transcription termination factor NusA [Bacilli bacterium]|nr:transcription termination factor NusA [Bacilli bacterium]
MARQKKLTKQEQFDNMLAQFREVADKRNLREETVLETFEVSYQKAIAKRHGGEGVNVKVSLNRIACEFDVYIYKTVVENEEAINDDALEMSLEAAREFDENAKVGEDVVIFHDYLSNLSAEIGRHGYQNFLQRLVELEKEQLFEIYKDKIGEMILGTIETAKNNRTTYANIGQTSVPLDDKQLINGERFQDGQLVPFYVVDVVSDPKGAKIILSRTDNGFVKGLLTKEVHEIYDGTVVIHDIVREPGERCKIAVSARDENVDPVGACIGPGGQRIQKVSAELGPSGKKEKIDIIPFSHNTGLYIIEAFRPAVPIGVAVDEENKSARVVFEMGEKGKALGQKGANVRLAKKLTGYDLVIMELDEANQAGVVYKNKEQLVFEQNLFDQEKAWQTIRDKQLEQLDNMEAVVAEVEDEPILAEEQTAEPVLVEESAPEVTVEVKPIAVPEVKAVEQAPQIEKVKTTISLAELEKELEEEKARPVQQQRRYKPRKNKEEEEVTVVTTEGPKMQIYTEEELRELEAQQHEEPEAAVFDDIDFEAFDEYYDE